ncbi:hypothetical protein [Chryseobacterium sp. RR2-3-20]|uniref:hypothetical protein n=1 Tax=Chryseobacterium sp. RR2-3-20 TaxID=2787626 RepID=UPI001AE0B1F8|nr:hypothetical protein [Chryseobacterium sp. RR2-3-20]
MKTKLLLVLLMIGLHYTTTAQVAHDYKPNCCRLAGATFTSEKSCYCSGCAAVDKKNAEAKAAEDKRVQEVVAKKEEEKKQKAIAEAKRQKEELDKKAKDSKANVVHLGFGDTKNSEAKKIKNSGNIYKVEVVGERLGCDITNPVLHKIYKNGKLAFETDNFFWIEPFINDKTGMFWASTSKGGCGCDIGINRKVFLNDKGAVVSIAGISNFYVAYQSGGEALVSVYDGSCQPDDSGESYVESKWGVTDYYLSLDDFSLLRTEKSKAKSPCDCNKKIVN